MGSPTNARLQADLQTIVTDLGKFDKNITEGGSHYIMPTDNVFAANGIACQNCLFFEPATNGCKIVDGYIPNYGVCKWWVIPDASLITTTTLAATALIVPTQTTGFDMNNMMNMIMMIMMLSMVTSMMRPMTSGR